MQVSILLIFQLIKTSISNCAWKLDFLKYVHTYIANLKFVIVIVYKLTTIHEK